MTDHTRLALALACAILATHLAAAAAPPKPAVTKSPQRVAAEKAVDKAVDKQLYGACTQCAPTWGSPEYSGTPQKNPPPGAAPANALRQRIIKAAAEGIGKVLECQDSKNPRQRMGADLLAQVFESSLGNKSAEKEARQIPHGKIDWCGIYAVAMAKKAGVDTGWGIEPSAEWRQHTKPTPGPRELQYAHPKKLQRMPGSEGLQAGDIMQIAHNQHLAIVERVTADTVYTIDGNMKCGGIYRNSRPRSQVIGYYRTVP